MKPSTPQTEEQMIEALTASIETERAKRRNLLLSLVPPQAPYVLDENPLAHRVAVLESQNEELVLACANLVFGRERWEVCCEIAIAAMARSAK